LERLRIIILLNFLIPGEKKPRQWFLMRSRRLIPVVALAIFSFPARSRPAYFEQNHESEREQKILRIQQLIQEHKLEEAHRQLAEAAKQYPADEGFDNLLGIVEAQQGSYAAAEKSFHQAIARAPKFTGAYLNLGKLYQENVAADPQARPKALDVYRQVLAYDPANAEANYESAALFLQQSEYQKSLDHISRLSSELQGSAQALSIRCADYAGLANRQGTDEAAARLLAAPDFSEPDAQQALLGLIPGKRDDLIVSVLESLQNHQQLSPAMLHTLGLAYERLNRLAEARATLEKSFAEGKSSVGLLLELTRIAHQQRDYQGALGYLAHARDLQPANAGLHYYFGVVCVDLNLIAEARNSFERAVKLEPENPDYNYAMGAASAFGHDPAEAVPYFEKYLKLKPQDPRGKLAMGATLFRAKDYDAAIPWLKECAGTTGTATKAHYYLGAIALEEGRLDEALVELQEALKAEADYPDALAKLGQYYLMRKDYEQAEKQIQRVLKIDPDHYAANFYLLTLYTRTKDSRQEAQAKRFEELKKLLAEKTQEFLRLVEVRPFETP
jgi:tetratricopeptide (TPR) repeat protein